MARKRSSTPRSRRKSDAEARVERITWALLVLVFAVLQLLPSTTAVPNFFVPFMGALILLGSGFYQYRRGWQVSPVTWIAGAFMAFFTYYNLRLDPNHNFIGEALIVFFVVIIFGVITGET